MQSTTNPVTFFIELHIFQLDINGGGGESVSGCHSLRFISVWILIIAEVHIGDRVARSGLGNAPYLGSGTWGGDWAGEDCSMV